MRMRIGPLTALTLLSLGASVPAAAGPLTVEFQGDLTFLSDAPLEKIEGIAEGVRGSVTLDPDDLSRTRGSFSVPVDGLKTGSPIRDEHLKGDDWLEAKKYPEIRFELSEVVVERVRRKGGLLSATGTAKGRFTLHGRTTPLSAAVAFKWKGKRAKAQLSFTIRLADYQVKGQSGVMGKKVGETIAISGVLRGAVRGGDGA